MNVGRGRRRIARIVATPIANTTSRLSIAIAESGDLAVFPPLGFVVAI
jgi:hypothetical protein